MRAAVINATGGVFVTEDIRIDQPIGREVLVDTKASGLCHTDLTFAENGLEYAPPCVFGHEVAGIVAAVGPAVTEFAAGDHVVGCLVQYCGHCTKCLAGKVYQCQQPGSTLRGPSDRPRLSRHGQPITQGFGLGGFAEQCLVHESQLVKIGHDIPFPQAALLGCAVVTGAGAVLHAANVQAGDAMVVVGAGGVGLNAISGGVIAGATTVVAVDIAEDKLEKARRFGATHTVDSTRTDPVAAVKGITGGGADAVFDFVGLPAVTAQALDMVAVGGGLYQIGIIDPTAVLPVSAIGQIALQRRLQGVIMGSTVPKRDIPVYAELYRQGKLNLDDLISREIRLDDLDDGYASLRDSATTRVVITSF